MPTTTKGGKKSPYAKAAAKKTPGAAKKKLVKKNGKGGAGGGGGDNVILGDPIIITGGGSVKLNFNPNKFKGKGGNRRDPNADLDSIIIDDPADPNGPRTYNVSAQTVITINFK